MRTVNIAELKSRLSTYLTYAKAGEEVIIRDQNQPATKTSSLCRRRGGPAGSKDNRRH
jgi:antitoxin (DNA-binding transcriptional repressor) of toxin-antitoxin stability system